jgi:hypothetical protein
VRRSPYRSYGDEIVATGMSQLRQRVILRHKSQRWSTVHRQVSGQESGGQPGSAPLLRELLTGHEGRQPFSCRLFGEGQFRGAADSAGKLP